MASLVETRRPTDAWTPTIAAGWILLVVGELSGLSAGLHHHALIEGGPPLWIAIPAFLTAWLVMLVAMMLPASRHALHVAGHHATGGDHAAGGADALLAFLAVWIAFGLAAFLGDLVVHHVVDATPWLSERPWLVEATVLAIAGGYQLAPWKGQALGRCRNRAQALAMGPAASQAPSPVLMGLRHGLDCLGSSWALMLLMFGEGFGGLGWMVALTCLMAYESTGRHGVGVSRVAGLVLILLALAALGGPGA